MGMYIGNIVSGAVADVPGNAIYIDKSINLAVDGATVGLNDNDLVLGNAAVISNYGPSGWS